MSSPADDGRAIRVGPWTRLTRQVAYENAWIRVWHDEVVRPDGQPGIYGVVHFANVAVGIVALDDLGRVLLVGQHRYTLDEYSWELPEGGVEAGESPLDGARRELLEESGYSAASWRELLRFTTSNSVADETGLVFVARDLTPGVASPDGTEDLAVRWVPFDEALAMIDRGEITDAISQIGLLRVALDRAGMAGGRHDSHHSEDHD
jgi:ADP-ribose pyrophosphatase